MESNRKLSVSFIYMAAMLGAALLFATACEPQGNYFVIRPDTATVAVGESLTLQVYSGEFEPGLQGGGSLKMDSQPDDPTRYDWSVQPADGASVRDGVFSASAPGEYVVTVGVLGEVDVVPAKIAVVGESDTVLDNHNDDSVQNGGTPPAFDIDDPVTITYVETYHFNDSNGTEETGQISLQAVDGTVYGPWDTEGAQGQGGVINAYWIARPSVELPAGTYTVVDSDPSTWSQNAGSQGQGMVRIQGASSE